MIFTLKNYGSGISASRFRKSKAISICTMISQKIFSRVSDIEIPAFSVISIGLGTGRFKRLGVN